MSWFNANAGYSYCPLLIYKMGSKNTPKKGGKAKFYPQKLGIRKKSLIFGILPPKQNGKLPTLNKYGKMKGGSIAHL